MASAVAPENGLTTNHHQGGKLFHGFTRSCKGLAVLLFGGYALVQIFPSSLTFLALIPARTIPFGWNLITAGYIEKSLIEVVINVLGLLFVGKFLEPIWGSREFLKFIFIVNILTSICAFVIAITLYYIMRNEIYLYKPLSGFHGVLSGFLVGIKQIMPDQELGLLKIKVKWIPSLWLVLSVILSFIVVDFASYLPTLIFGIYTSWLYLRYLQRKPETSIRGDPSDEFAFSTFFPEFLRPVVEPIASLLSQLLCGCSDKSGQPEDRAFGISPLPGSDPIEASRRRERGARALEQRLAAEKLSTMGRDQVVDDEKAAENV